MSEKVEKEKRGEKADRANKAEKAEKPEKAQRNQKGKSSLVKPRPNEFEQKISSILKNHLPKPPLFSKITNDIQTINTFFQDKFDQAKLLYRAS